MKTWVVVTIALCSLIIGYPAGSRGEPRFSLTNNKGPGSNGSGVVNSVDACSGLDDRPDINHNGKPDCSENLVKNGQFFEIKPWTVMNPLDAQIHLSADARNFERSHSLALVNTLSMSEENTDRATGADSECISILPSTDYGIYAEYYMPSVELDATGISVQPDMPPVEPDATWITVQTYEDDACTKPRSSISGGELGLTKDRWAFYTRSVSTDRHENSMKITLGNIKGSGKNIETRFDNVLVVKENR